MNANSHIPERGWIDRRIERAIERMFAALNDRWAYAWADLASRLIEERRRSAH